MLSILIPTYNYNCLELVKSLNKQALELDIEYEILVIDDCSCMPSPANKEINLLANCKYSALNKNIGRAKIRNLLAKKAQYGKLLFIDCDAEICSDSFLKRYMSFMKEESVVCGGCTYNQHGIDPSTKLRLYYGIKRESSTAKERQEKPYLSFSSFNFLISKNIFEQIKFDETITQYGHEDTIFGCELIHRKITIYHIDNALIHAGLESSTVFLEKTKTSIGNLILIHQQKNSTYTNINKEIKLLYAFRKLERLHLHKIFGTLFNPLKNPIEKNLLGEKPNIYLFDLYKLTYLCFLNNEADKLSA
jgi:glycosyltransferase involved in cell wall biosynthesis